MPSPGRRPRHGNLRDDLLEAAAVAVEAVGPAKLSLREVARRTGVSHAAPAHHFGDKQGLFTALAARGFRLLHHRTSPTLDRPHGLTEAARRYVEFALDHPGYFSVMFDVSLVDPDDPEYQRERGVAFDVLSTMIRDAVTVRDDDELAALTIAAWTSVHGVATLWLSGNLPYARDSALVAGVMNQLGPLLARVAEAGAHQLDGATGPQR